MSLAAPGSSLIAGPLSASRSVEAADGRTAHNNGQNRANGMASNTSMCLMYLIPFHSFLSSPAITTSLSSPIKVPPTSCAVCLSVSVCLSFHLSNNVASPSVSHPKEASEILMWYLVEVDRSTDFNADTVYRRTKKADTK